MRTRKISHFGILVHDADAATAAWCETFGFQVVDDRLIDVEGIRSVFMSLGGTWDEMVIEIMEPQDKADMSNALAKRLATRGEGFYHLCLDVDGIGDSAAELEDRGITVMMRDAVSPGDHPRWLVHPKDMNGVMVEAIDGGV
jgi:methylmalonyl-CoA/ethylmalonyl-CoA epimerase